MTSENDDHALGVLTPDSARIIAVVADEGELAVALYDRIDRAFAVVHDLRPDEAVAGFAACIPWPWMVVGNTPTLSEEAIASLRDRPVLVYWRGTPPEGMPNHTRVFERFTDLSNAVNGALTQVVAGMKLAVGLGIDLPDGSFARSAELQALVANHPYSFDVPLDAFRSAARVLGAHNISWRPVRDQDTGNVALVDQGVGAAP